MSRAAPPRRAAALWPLWLLIAACCLPEALLSLSDHGLFGLTRWRTFAVQNGAFWPGLLQDWRPNYPGQPALMFVSYMFLHGGPGHLFGNMAALLWLGLTLLPRLGPGRFIALYLGCGVLAAATFALMVRGPTPMIGASGAVFGLFGAWAAGELRALGAALKTGGAARREGLLWLARVAFILVLANLATLLVQPGPTAWQAHLGGALAGLIAGAALLRS